MSKLGTFARVTLAIIRIVNGAAALFAPEVMSKRMGVDPQEDPSTMYALRMFGVRTVVIGADLLRRKDEELEDALRLGILIHASDSAAAAIAGKRGQLPAKTARTGMVISLVNTGLATTAYLAESRSR
jgi:uncharacterized protein YjeT (DUF2065 family)